MVITNRDKFNTSLQNVEVRITNNLPTSKEEMFTDGHLLGNFSGPGMDGQIIQVPERSSKDLLGGRFVIIQMNNRDYLSLDKVVVSGFLSHPGLGRNNYQIIKSSNI